MNETRKGSEMGESMARTNNSVVTYGTEKVMFSYLLEVGLSTQS